MKENYEAKGESCICCGLIGEGLVCWHHVKTRGSGGGDEKENLIPVCALHHQVFHNRKNEYMATKFPSVRKWLTQNGWSFCDTRKKWIR